MDHQPERRRPLVGRGAEREVLARALDEAAGGSLRALVIEGEPGIGKTRLLDELRAMASARGFAVAHAVADEELPLPFGVARSLLASASSGDAEPQVFAGDAAPPGNDREHALADAVDRSVSLLRQATTRRPLALLVDDAHWMDDASTPWLKYLGGIDWKEDCAARGCAGATGKPRTLCGQQL